MLPDRVDHAERIGRVAKICEVPGEDRAICFSQYGSEALNGLKSHVNVTEADETHRAVVAAALDCCNDDLPKLGVA